MPTKGKGIASKVLSVIPKAINIVSGKKPNPKWDYKLKSGEKHTTIIRDGVAYTDRYAGPGSKVYDNTMELIQRFGSLSEALAQASDWSPDPAVSLAGLLHDVQYALAGQEYIDGNTAKSKARVERADKRFLKDLMGAKSFINAIAPGSLIKAKSDVLPYSSFIEKTKPLTQKEIRLYNEVLKEFGEQEAYTYPIEPKPIVTRVGDTNTDLNAFTVGGKRGKQRPLRGGCDCQQGPIRKQVKIARLK